MFSGAGERERLGQAQIITLFCVFYKYWNNHEFGSFCSMAKIHCEGCWKEGELDQEGRFLNEKAESSHPLRCEGRSPMIQIHLLERGGSRSH